MTNSIKFCLLAILILFLAWNAQCQDIKVCDDALAAKHCKFLQKHNACKTHAKRMKVLCPKSCKFCNITEATRNPCDNMTCSFGQDCYWRLDGTARCKCNLTCNSMEKKSGPVCGGNQQTYEDLCAMRMDQCKTKKKILVYHYGHCIQQDICMDVLPIDCKQLQKKGLCKTSLEIMQFFCPRTCRLCRQPAPQSSCLKSKYGCCWNKNVPATGANQQGCKACKEALFCPNFKELCSQESNMATMRQYCPKSCRYC